MHKGKIWEIWNTRIKKSDRLHVPKKNAVRVAIFFADKEASDVAYSQHCSSLSVRLNVLLFHDTDRMRMAWYQKWEAQGWNDVIIF